MNLSRQYAKLCDVADFADEELQQQVAAVAPALAGMRHRKAWEFAIGAMFLRDTGHLDDRSEVLDVGAGSEDIAFYLANHAGRVTAIDIYGRGDFGDREAVASMLEDPGTHAPYSYREDRLEVRDMDARTLDFPDASFDAVVSFSSIEHFGSPGDIRSSAREIGRVLKPGGHAFLVTEVLFQQHPLDHAPVLFAIRLATLGRRARNTTLRSRGLGDQFTFRELHKQLIEPSGLELMQPLDRTISPASFENIVRIGPDGIPFTSTGEPEPHVVLATNLSRFTSVCLPLVKR